MVYEDILKTEAKERSMLLWLRNLRIHSFEARHFENVAPQHLDNVTRVASENLRKNKTVVNEKPEQNNTNENSDVNSKENEIELNSKSDISEGRRPGEVRKLVYRDITRSMHGTMGSEVWRRLPNCVEDNVRRMFPLDDGKYMGYKDK